MNPIPCCIFSYREDSHEVVLAAKSAALSGFFPVYVVDQADKPITSHCRALLEADDVIIVTSSFQRGKNLNGIDCLFGMLQVYRNILNQTGAAHVFKIDSDTMVVRPDKVLQAAAAGFDVFGWNSAQYPLYGCSCLLSAGFIDELIQFIKTWSGIPGMSNQKLWEDQAVAFMAGKLRPSTTGIMPYDPEGGFGSFWCWQEPKEYFRIFRERFDVVNFGNRLDQEKQKVSKVESYMIQSSFLDFLEKWQIPSSSGLRQAG